MSKPLVFLNNLASKAVSKAYDLPSSLAKNLSERVTKNQCFDFLRNLAFIHNWLNSGNCRYASQS